jgi:transposase
MESSGRAPAPPASDGRPGVEIEVISCYEAGHDGFWLHHLLEAHGVHNHVLDPASLLVNRRAKPAKTDGIDVERMQRALSRYLRGEPDACSVVRVPSVEEEDAKRLHRERKRLISERVQHVNRTKGLFDRLRGNLQCNALGINLPSSAGSTGRTAPPFTERMA